MTPRSKPLIGVTGAIGAGKSVALAVLEELGAATLSADAVVADLYLRAEVVDLISERYGLGYVRDGQVDRGALSVRVLTDPDEKQWLESKIWPLVIEEISVWVANQQTSSAESLAIEVPLLFEAGLERLFDFTLAIVAPNNVRAKRLESRGDRLINERERGQLSQEEKARRASFSVANDQSVAELRAQLAEILNSWYKSRDSKLIW